ncbi:vesicle-associated membrane protein-associated protein B/C-like isoform X2 [Dysidea avara]|uniref:vesicle-associated membrane protein-associated protein B/C-like isoform X2 n=1 Tax=Dysidea avara TaxID=196820 RepID=UPI00332AB1E5
MGVKPEQVLTLEPPQELRFKGPFKEVVTSYLKITNPSNERVCFKVKTTAPRQYCVRPNSGLLEPKQSQTVSVMLQPLDITNVDKSKHKFMVQSMYPPVGEVKLEEIWKSVKKDELMDSKLRCVFEEGSDDNSTIKPTDDVPVVQPSTPKQDDVMMSTIEDLSQTNAGNTPSASVTSTTAQDRTRSQQNEIDRLSGENNQLKSDLNQLRMRRDDKTALPTATQSPTATQRGGGPQSSSSPNLMLVVLIILVALVMGYFVGRLL